MAGNNKKDNVAVAEPATVHAPGRQVTKADVILQRQTEIISKIDTLIASVQSTMNSVSEKVMQELVYLSKQNSVVYEKVMQECEKLRNELNYMAMQNEQVFLKVNEQTTEIARKIEEQPAFDYDKLAEALDAREAAKDIYDGHADEVAPAAAEQLAMSDYFDYDEIAERVSQKIVTLTEVPVGDVAIDYDELAKKIADSLPPQEFISADYIASKVAEQIVGEGAVEFASVLDYDRLAERVAEMVSAAAQEEIVAASAEDGVAGSVSASAFASADVEAIARRVAELTPNEFDIFVNEEGCHNLAGSIVEILDYDKLSARLSDRLNIAAELAAAEVTESGELSGEEIATLVTEKLAANGFTEDAIADKTAAAISNYLPEVDTDEIADKVVSALLPSLSTAPAIDYDAIVGSVAQTLAENQNDYDIVIDEEGLQKMTDSISWKVTASTNAMLEDMGEKLAKVQSDADYIRGALDAAKQEEVVEAAAEDMPAESALAEIKTKLDELLSIFNIVDEEAEEYAEGEEPEEAEAEGEIYDPIAEMLVKLDEILEKLAVAEEVAATDEAGEETMVGSSDEVAEIKGKLDEILEKFAVMEELAAEELDEEAADEEPDEVAEIKAKLDEIIEKLMSAEEVEDAAAAEESEDGGFNETAEIKGKLDEIIEKLTATEEVEEAAEEVPDPIADELDIIHAKLDELLSVFESVDAEEEFEDEEPDLVAEELEAIHSKLDELIAAHEASSAEEQGPDPVAEELNSIQAKLDELLSAFETVEEEAEDEGVDEVAEIKAKLDEILEKFNAAEEAAAAEVSEAASKERDELSGIVAEELDSIHSKLDELFAVLEPAEEVDEGPDEVAEIKIKLDELIAKIDAMEEPKEEDLPDIVAEELDSIHSKLDELIAAYEAAEEEQAPDPVVGELDAIHSKLDELLAALESDEAEEEIYEDPLEDYIQEIKSGLDELKNDPAIRELQGEVSELTSRIDSLTKPDENADVEIVVMREEISEISRQIEELKEILSNGLIMTAHEIPSPEDQPEEQTAPEHEEELVTVSDLVDETDEIDDEVDEAIENIFEDVAEETVEGEAEPDGILGIGKGGVDFANMMKYNRSFIARIIQSTDDVKRYYGQIKNAMLAYKKVNSSIAWGAERFNKGRETIAKLKIRGKTLCLYLNLDPNEFPTSVYHQVDVSDNKSMHGTPMMVKVKSPLGARKAIRLIDAMLAKRNGEKRAIHERDYAAMYPYETIEELIEDGLVKDVSKNK